MCRLSVDIYGHNYFETTSIYCGEYNIAEQRKIAEFIQCEVMLDIYLLDIN